VGRGLSVAVLGLGMAGSGCASLLGIDGDYEDAVGGSGSGAAGSGASGTGANGTGGGGTGANGSGGGGTGSASSGGGGNASGGGSTGGASGCPTAGGDMANLTTFCMDRTEVTNAAYRAWVDTGPSTAMQQSYCSWNGNFGSASSNQLPVVDVDWCDAAAFCKAHGKRLCGRVGQSGMPTPFALLDDANESEWYRTCVGASADNTYPYGDVYDSETCFGFDHSTSGTQVVGSAPNCHGVSSASEVFDLSGNVAEWTNACEVFVGQDDKCATRGGDHGALASELTCDDDEDKSRDQSEDDIGFRCCADL